MGIPVSLILIAVGAILVWGVSANANGINVDAVGVILMVVGLIGFLLSLIWWDRFGLGYWRRSAVYDAGAPGYRAGYDPGAPGYRAGSAPHRRTVVEEDGPAPPVDAPPPPPDAPPY
jgi:hypothetical protein